MKNIFHRILHLFTQNEYPEATNQQFYKWLTEEEHQEEKNDALKKVWYRACKYKYSKKSLNHSYTKLQTTADIPLTKKQAQIHSIRIWQSAAAALLILAASSLYLLSLRETPQDLIQQYIPTAQTQTLTLPDGSKVQLNSQSTLLYPSQFNGKNRSVFLLGEANFKVTPDKKHPFIVKTNDLQVTVLGTEFNMSAYPEDEEVTTTLLSGSICVDLNDLTTSVILKPNEQLTYNRKNKKELLTTADIEDVTAWQRGEIVFRQTTVKDIVTLLERKYNYTFVYNTETLQEDLYSFRFHSEAPIDQVMSIISGVVGNLNYQINEEERTVIIK